MDCELCGRFVNWTSLPDRSGAPRGEREDYLCERCERMQKEQPEVFRFVVEVLAFAMKPKADE